MDTYLCQYFLQGEQSNRLYFKCQADDADHATEQLMDAVPSAVSVLCEIMQRGEKADPVEKEKGEKVKKWVGDPPEACDVCGGDLHGEFVDGVIRHGPWANMCLPCHTKLGVGLGLGKGQHYKKRGDEWPKVAG